MLCFFSTPIFSCQFVPFLSNNTKCGYCIFTLFWALLPQHLCYRLFLTSSFFFEIFRVQTFRWPFSQNLHSQCSPNIYMPWTPFTWQLIQSTGWQAADRLSIVLKSLQHMWTRIAIQNVEAMQYFAGHTVTSYYTLPNYWGRIGGPDNLNCTNREQQQ